MQRKIMPDIVNKQSISALKPDNTVYEAATMMAKVNVAAIVVEDDKLVLKHRRFGDIELSPNKEHEFGGGFPVAEVVFKADDAGVITSLEVGNGRTRGVRFVRVE